MEKDFSVKVGDKSVSMKAPVVGSLAFNEPAPDPQLVEWLTSRPRTGEKGIVGRRIGGICLILVGIPLGIFALMCFPGLAFWFVGALALGALGGGLVLMSSRREKKPESAFRTFFSDCLLNTSGTSDVSFGTMVFKMPDAICKRANQLSPSEEVRVSSNDYTAFLNQADILIKGKFVECGRALAEPNTQCTYGSWVEAAVSVEKLSEQLHRANGIVNVVRKTPDSCHEIVELHTGIYLINIGGNYSPVHLVPDFQL